MYQEKRNTGGETKWLEENEVTDREEENNPKEKKNVEGKVVC
jgi:ribosome-associated protein YbcJ (S4-like RNA binding protein)